MSKRIDEHNGYAKLFSESIPAIKQHMTDIDRRLENIEKKEETEMKLNDKVYDVLKWIVLIVLPALSTFYAVLAPLFNWYDPGAVAQVISAFCALIGSIIGISTAEYNKEVE